MKTRTLLLSLLVLALTAASSLAQNYGRTPDHYSRWVRNKLPNIRFVSGNNPSGLYPAIQSIYHQHVRRAAGTGVAIYYQGDFYGELANGRDIGGFIAFNLTTEDTSGYNRGYTGNDSRSMTADVIFVDESADHIPALKGTLGNSGSDNGPATVDAYGQEWERFTDVTYTVWVDTGETYTSSWTGLATQDQITAHENDGGTTVDLGFEWGDYRLVRLDKEIPIRRQETRRYRNPEGDIFTTELHGWLLNGPNGADYIMGWIVQTRQAEDGSNRRESLRAVFVAER